MPIDGSIYGALNTDFGRQLGDVFNPDAIKFRQNKLAEAALDQKYKQVQMDDAIAARQEKLLAAKQRHQAMTGLPPKYAQLAQLGVPMDKLVDMMNSDAARAAYEQRGAGVDIPLDYNPDEVIAQVEAIPDQAGREQLRTAMSQSGFGVPEKRPLTHDEQVQRALEFGSSGAKGSDVPYKMMEFQQKSDDTKQTVKDKLDVLRQNAIDKIEESKRRSIEMNNTARLIASMKQNPEDAPPKAEPGTRMFKDESGNWKAEIIPQSTKWQNLKSKESMDRAFVQNAVPTYEKNVDDIEALVNHPGLDKITGLIGSLTPNISASARDAAAKLDQVVGAMETAGYQMMKSTSGSAGSMSQQEWPKMQTYFNIIKTSPDPVAVRSALMGASQTYQRMKDIAKESYMNEWGSGQFGDKNVIDRLSGSKPSQQATSQPITVTAPDGSVHPFASQVQADAFKKMIGVR